MNVVYEDLAEESLSRAMEYTERRFTYKCAHEKGVGLKKRPALGLVPYIRQKMSLVEALFVYNVTGTKDKALGGLEP